MDAVRAHCSQLNTRQHRGSRHNRGTVHTMNNSTSASPYRHEAQWTTLSVLWHLWFTMTNERKDHLDDAGDDQTVNHDACATLV